MSPRKDASAEETACIDALLKCQTIDDTERAHIVADNALRDFVLDLGYQEVVEEYDKVNKWY